MESLLSLELLELSDLVLVSEAFEVRDVPPEVERSVGYVGSPVEVIEESDSVLEVSEVGP